MAELSILITGGAGFVGSHLCEAYLKRGYQVVAVDNFSTSTGHALKRLANSNFKFFEHDICQPLPKALIDEDIDAIANLASPASPPRYQALALETLAVGSLGMMNVLELARQKKARLMQASTSEVYGDPDVDPQPETYRGVVNPYGPRSMYDESKRFAEAMVYSYRRKYKLNTAIARIFNTYGPYMDSDDGRVVTNFITQALTNRPITVYGDGSQTRSFCYIDDLISGIIALIDSDEEGPINLGNPVEFTINELAEKVLELTKSQSKIIYKPLPADDPMQRRPDIALAGKRLGWQPKVDLEEGLIKTINYFKNQIS